MAYTNYEPWTTAPSSPYRPDNPNAWTTNGAQNQTAAPAATQTSRQAAGGQDYTGDPFAQAFKGLDWGTFGTYDNWANAYAAEHGGYRPNPQAIGDYWDSQVFMAKNGRPPSYSEWNNRWYTGDWLGKNAYSTQRIPFRHVGGDYPFGRTGYEWGFEPSKGLDMSPEYRQAAAAPWNLPPWLRPGMDAWLNFQKPGGVPQLAMAGSTAPNPPTAPVWTAPTTPTQATAAPWRPPGGPHLVNIPGGAQMPIIVKREYTGPAEPYRVLNAGGTSPRVPSPVNPWPANAQAVPTPQMGTWGPVAPNRNAGLMPVIRPGRY
jgi:hypothetical protein